MALIPLSALPFALYFIGSVIFAAVSADAPNGAENLPWGGTIVPIQLASGAIWSLTYSDGLITLALAALLLTAIRTARASRTTVSASLVSVVALAVHVVMFLTVSVAATSTFFMLTMIALVSTIVHITLSMVVSPAPPRDPQ